MGMKSSLPFVLVFSLVYLMAAKEFSCGLPAAVFKHLAKNLYDLTSCIFF